MVNVDIADLESDLKNGIVEFMESKLPLKSERNGDVVTFEDKSTRAHVTSPEVRTYLKRYIHLRDVKRQYRILSEGGSLKLVKKPLTDEDKEEDEKKEK